MQNGLIDTHCHLTFPYDGKTPADLIKEAVSNGVHTLITIATEPENFESVQKISSDHANVFHTIGVHPHDTSKVTPETIDLMRKYLAHPKCLAVGEIGLDYFYEHTDREKQKQECRAQCELALEVQKPIVVHSRDGEEDLLAILKEYAQAHRAKKLTNPLGVIHCFTGSNDFARECVGLGFYISFSGIFTFKNAENLRELAPTLPKNKILVETDAPFLAPVPLRGKKCEPYMVKHTAFKLAEVLGISYEELCALTTQNAKACFQIP